MYYEILQKIESSGSKQDDLTELQAAGWDFSKTVEEATLWRGRLFLGGDSSVTATPGIARVSFVIPSPQA